MTREVTVTLRDRNQLTLPDPVAKRLGVEVGDQLVITVSDDDPAAARLVPLRRSYAGVARDLYGKDHEEVLGYIDTERASWESGAGTAADGTRFLPYDKARRIHPKLTRDQYEREPKWRWPRCGICGRLIARINEHTAMHREGRLDERGLRRDPEQVARSRARVAKWRVVMARKRKVSR